MGIEQRHKIPRTVKPMFLCNSQQHVDATNTQAERREYLSS